MSAWFKKERKPRVSQRARLEIPRDAWDKCESCGHVDIRERFERELNVCPNCGQHRRFSAEEYVELLSDAGTWRELNATLRAQDPLKFEHYPDRTKASQKKTGQPDAMFTGLGKLEGIPLHLGVMNFAYMGGSMGSVVGERFVRGVEHAIAHRTPLVCFSASGGARMQEGLLSLLQMAKTSASLAALAAERLPFISVQTDPTTGGVSASLAMLGDVNIAEPKALIGFAGPRVIQQTVRETLPEGFQRSEFLLDHGAIDMILDRRELRERIASMLRILLRRPAASG